MTRVTGVKKHFEEFKYLGFENSNKTEPKKKKKSKPRWQISATAIEVSIFSNCYNNTVH
jgi:hypothetical protein